MQVGQEGEAEEEAATVDEERQRVGADWYREGEVYSIEMQSARTFGYKQGFNRLCPNKKCIEGVAACQPPVPLPRRVLPAPRVVPSSVVPVPAPRRLVAQGPAGL